MANPLKHVYGPVDSGRLGRSLGVDPFFGEKTCNFDCVYCQLGKAEPHTAGAGRFANSVDVVEEATAALRRGAADWITISGSGEPTLHPRLGPMITALREETGLPIAVVTNGSRLLRRDVREALSRADAVLPTLAAAEPGTHWLMHRPRGVGAFRRHVEGLMMFRESYRGMLWLEVMLVKGVNDDDEHLAELAKLVRLIRPDEVHLTRPTRPSAELWVEAPKFTTMLRAMKELDGVVVRTNRPSSAPRAHDPERALDTIARAVQRHPIRESEALSWLELAGVDEPSSALERLIGDHRIRRTAGRAGVFLAPR